MCLRSLILPIKIYMTTTIMRSIKIKKKVLKNKKGSLKQLAFMGYYLSPEIDGKINPCYGNATRSAKKVGYSDSYAEKILSRIRGGKTNVSEKIVKVRKGLEKTLQEKGVDSEWIAELVKKLGEKKDKTMFQGKLVDSGDPDSQAGRIALDFVAKTQGLYKPEKHSHKYDGFSKEELIEIILKGVGGATA